MPERLAEYFLAVAKLRRQSKGIPDGVDALIFAGEGAPNNGAVTMPSACPADLLEGRLLEGA